MKIATKLLASPSPASRSITAGSNIVSGKRKKGGNMLETILIILVVLWALGFFAFHVGGLVHVLLVIAAVVLIIRLLQGRRVL